MEIENEKCGVKTDPEEHAAATKNKFDWDENAAYKICGCNPETELLMNCECSSFSVSQLLKSKFNKLSVACSGCSSGKLLEFSVTHRRREKIVAASGKTKT